MSCSQLYVAHLQRFGHVTLFDANGDSRSLLVGDAYGPAQEFVNIANIFYFSLILLS